ncbi:MAG: molecular chaperone DnaJ [Thermodesulfobacteriota bacterium]
MTIVVAEHELYRACQILFGLELQLSREFLEYLQMSGVKSAYRQRARETHPDLADGDMDKRQCADLFHKVQTAYENLRCYLEAREKGFSLGGGPVAAPPRPKPAQPRPRPAAGSPHARPQWQGANREGQWQRQNGCTVDIEKLYRGPLPSRPLLFGHFLYYSGVINWRTVVQALVWQRMQRPRLGELARRRGWLDEESIRRILDRRNGNRNFGETAIHLGMLDENQRAILVWQQKRMQRKIGGYFVEANILSPERLALLVERCRQHNAVWRGRSAGCC